MIEKYKEALREAFQDFDLLDYKYSIDIDCRLFDTNEYGSLKLRIGDYDWIKNSWGRYTDFSGYRGLYNRENSNKKDMVLYKIKFNFFSKNKCNKSSTLNAYKELLKNDIDVFKIHFDEAIEKLSHLLEPIIFKNHFEKLDVNNYLDSKNNMDKIQRVSFHESFTLFILGNRVIYRGDWTFFDEKE